MKPAWFVEAQRRASDANDPDLTPLAAVLAEAFAESGVHDPLVTLAAMWREGVQAGVQLAGVCAAVPDETLSGAPDPRG